MRATRFDADDDEDDEDELWQEKEITFSKPSLVPPHHLSRVVWSLVGESSHMTIAFRTRLAWPASSASDWFD